MKWEYGLFVALFVAGLYAAETIDFNVARELNLNAKPPDKAIAAKVVSWSID